MSATSTFTTPITLVSQIDTQQTALELSDAELCQALGFDRQIVLSLIKQGTMRMPLTKIPALAVAIQLDPISLMKQALLEQDPALSKIIADLFNPLHLTSSEVNLVKHLRKLCGDTPTSSIVFDGKGVVALVAVKS